MEVTRLKCGGFVVGSHICHNIGDGFGTIQILKDIFDLARGKAKPGTLPVWERELLMARSPPQVTEIRQKYEALFNEVSRSIFDDIMLATPIENMVCEYFTFSPSDVAALRCLVPLHPVKTVTSFELLTAIMWRSRTVVLAYQPSQHVPLMITMTARRRWSILSDGFYGNALLCPIVETTISDLCMNPLSDTIELVRKAKLEMTTEETCNRWPIGWQLCDELDIGWAKRISGGMPAAAGNKSPDIISHFVYKNEKGENMIVVSMLLPRTAMEKFRKELIAVWLKNC
uniref:Uncharacterized protein n=1 Tax=Oryza punctata TaxID=4537 RepID=A0A0E0MLH8_ORYPU